MKILKVKSRTYKGKPYFKHRINLSDEMLNESGFKDGDELETEVKRGEIKLKKSNHN